MVAMIFPEVPSITYSFGGKATPSWSAHPTRKLLPGPWTMLVGKQLGVGKVLMTTGPFGLLGSISSTVPTVRSVGLALPFVTRKCPVLGLKAEPPIPVRATAPKPLPGGASWLEQ